MQLALLFGFGKVSLKLAGPWEPQNEVQGVVLWHLEPVKLKVARSHTTFLQCPK